MAGLFDKKAEGFSSAERHDDSLTGFEGGGVVGGTGIGKRAAGGTGDGDIYKCFGHR